MELSRVGLVGPGRAPGEPANAAAAEHGLRHERYIVDHITLLDSLGQTELADAFRDWRNRLQS